MQEVDKGAEQWRRGEMRGFSTQHSYCRFALAIFAACFPPLSTPLLSSYFPKIEKHRPLVPKKNIKDDQQHSLCPNKLAKIWMLKLYLVQIYPQFRPHNTVDLHTNIFAINPFQIW
ncbi:hypothetical protein GOODEAATRI_025635 [Goodea atripinnis]|uniref:Uncharacterized protein n=1 Tax=Goodea atripinnis TaxID=208336 RepID=A0ABV0MKR3_9TELE